MAFFKATTIFLLALLNFQQISCQLDYDTDAGLGDSFQPSVKASCIGGTMTIRVDTKKPFSGIIHGPNRTEAGCSIEGRGGLKTYLKIDLGKAEGSIGSCGVKYNALTEERKIAVAVRAHPTIELLEDRLFVVTCGRAGFQNSRNEVSVVELKVTLPGQQDQKITTVLEGSRYQLRAEVQDYDAEYDILVRRCFAFDETETSLQLVDDRGCAIERLISNFEYDKARGAATATIRSMFRLPHSNRTYFQCDMAICKGNCPKPNCNANNDEQLKLQAQGQLLNLEDRKVDKSDPFDRPDEADTITTSTSVFVAQPGSEGSAAAIYCTGGWGAGDLSWLKWLCIAFGILFGIMLLINIFLCSAMTCSCTKSEIIEKEPSVYDDYSIYESQYGYTNQGKGFGSESEYGSEYGSTGEREQHNQDQYPNEPSESGTLRSKYSQARPTNSTLTRQRY